MLKYIAIVIVLSVWLVSFAACSPSSASAPTSTPRPTIPPAPTVAVVDFSDITLLQSDMPTGFEPPTSKDSFIDPTQSLTGATLEAQFGFVRKGKNPELITGATVRVPDPANQVAVDLYLSKSDKVIDAFADGLSKKIFSKQALAGLERVGDAAAGASVTYLEGKERLTLDLAVFRKGEAVIYLAMAYRENDLPPLPLSAYAYKLAARAGRLAASPKP
jgi:hypothetical protein